MFPKIFVISVLLTIQLVESLHQNLEVTLANPVARIRGHTLKSANGNLYYGFQDIPYAKPPIGKRRFMVPEPHPGWEGVYEAIKNNKVCIQPLSTSVPQSEDCLYLNVYTPIDRNSTKKLAVFVWIHGGAYLAWDGAIDRYSPKYLMDYNIVVVTLNYRLGVLGFLTTNDGIIDGNLGLRDQNLALKWVKDNIHVFGGDPNKITIGGESAGAASAGFHTLSPMSKGLFRGAILQSSSALSPYSWIPNPRDYAFQLGRLLDTSFNTNNSTKLLNMLQQADINDIMKNALKVKSSEYPGGMNSFLIWCPTVENDSKIEPFMSKPMGESLTVGNFEPVPVLLGFCSEEFISFIPNSSLDLNFKIETDTALRQQAAQFDKSLANVISKKVIIDDEDRFTAGKLLKNLYTNSTFEDDLYAFIQVCSDINFCHSITRHADLISKFVPTYLYQFSYMAETYSRFPGADHTQELKYLWYNVNDPVDVTGFQSIVRHRMLKLWTNFIKYLNPTPKMDEDFANIIWPVVKQNDIQYLNINETFSILKDPRKYQDVKKIWNTFQHPPIYVT